MPADIIIIHNNNIYNDRGDYSSAHKQRTQEKEFV